MGKAWVKEEMGLGTLGHHWLVCMKGWREKATLLHRKQRQMTQVVHFVNLEGKRPSLMGAVDIVFPTHSHREHGDLCHQFTPFLDLGNFLGGSDGKESVSKAGDLVSILGSGRAPGERNDSPLQYSCLRNPMDRRAWRATVHGATKSRTQLSGFHFTWLLCLGELKALQSTGSLLGEKWRRDVCGAFLTIWGPNSEEGNDLFKATLSKGLVWGQTPCLPH